MNTLIVYYSYTLNNEKLAKALQKELACDLFRVEEKKRRTGFTIFLDQLFNRNPSIKATSYALEDYDQIILISPIWAGRIASPLRSFIKAERERIKCYSFITVCGGVKGQKDKIVEELNHLLKCSPETVMELWVSALAQRKGDLSKMPQYKVEQNDLDFFDANIKAFLRTIKMGVTEH